MVVDTDSQGSQPRAVRAGSSCRALAAGVVLAAVALGGCRAGQPQTDAPCTFGDLRCVDDATYETCVGAGRWAPGFCSPDQYCTAGACRAIVCAPDEYYCSADNVTVLRCDETGTEYEPIASCADTLNGLCVGRGNCISLCEPGGKSYIGCEYFAADLDNAFVPGGSGYYDAASEQFAVVVSNADALEEAVVAVTTRYEVVDSAIVPPRGIHIFNLPRRDVNGTVLDALAYRVSSNVPISAYQFNPLENVNVFSNDASLLFPTHTLGDYYFVMTREQTFRDLKGFVTVIATSAGATEVSVTVTAPTLAGPGIPALQPGESFFTTMLRFDVLNIETNAIGADLTGSIVLASKPVAVFGGSEAANAPNTNHCGADGLCEWDGRTPCASNADCSRFITCCADHLEHQLLPVDAWGKRHVIGRSFPRGLEADYIRVLASRNGTAVWTDPPLADCLLDAGQWCEFETLGDVEVLSDKPVMVGQFLAAEHAPNPNVDGAMEPGDARIGDPSFILAVPVEQFRSEYVFLAPDKYALDYVTIVAPAGSAVYLDNSPLAPALFGPVGAGEYVAARLPISDGFHLVQLEQPGGVIVYGYDQYVSYGYPAGLNLNVIED